MIKILPYWILVITLFACNKGKQVENDNFDRKGLLQQVTNELIKPSFTTLKAKVDLLVSSADNFTQNVNSTTLTQLQTAWQDAYTAYQYSCAYNFGMAGEEGLRKGLVEEIATFPVNTTKIETAIANNNPNFNDFNRDARGFLAIEYLIFEPSNNFQEQNRKNYLVGLANNLKSRVTEVVNSWEGDYTNTFIANDGTSAGSSTSVLYNEFLKSFEALKNFKVALPLGKRAGQTQTEPTRVEAYYSGKSLLMLKNHLQALEGIWRKFIPYLQSVEGGNALISATETQLTNAKNALNAVSETPAFSVQIQNNPASLESIFTELQKLTRYFKSDMSSILGIAITYSSGDGD